jgi:hypothetical protein
MKKLLGLFTAAALATGMAALAQDGGNKDMKKAGQDVKQAGKDTGQAAPKKSRRRPIRHPDFAGATFVPVRVNSNFRIHTRGPSAEANFQRRAALNAALEKYWLDPSDSSVAFVTSPEESTSTRTLAVTLPRMLFRARGSTSGITCCTISR